MKRLATFIAMVLVAGTFVWAHGNNDHVSGVVTAISAESITVQTTDKAEKKLVLNSKTTFEKAGKPAGVSDLQVGDRVVIEVPKKTTEARLIRVGTAPKPAVAKKATAAVAKKAS